MQSSLLKSESVSSMSALSARGKRTSSLDSLRALQTQTSLRPQLVRVQMRTDVILDVTQPTPSAFYMYFLIKQLLQQRGVGESSSTQGSGGSSGGNNSLSVRNDHNNGHGSRKNSALQALPKSSSGASHTSNASGTSLSAKSQDSTSNFFTDIGETLSALASNVSQLIQDDSEPVAVAPNIIRNILLMLDPLCFVRYQHTYRVQDGNSSATNGSGQGGTERPGRGRSSGTRKRTMSVSSSKGPGDTFSL